MHIQIPERLKQIRQRMREEKLDAYIVLSDDFHTSEYVGEHFRCREYISGFTGSSASVVILLEEAGLWTDGRYFIQAEEQLAGSGITLYRIGEEGVPKLEDYLNQKLAEHAHIGMDGRTITAKKYRKLEKKLQKKQIKICLNYDLAGEIWPNRPKMSCEQAWELDVCYAGRSRAEKLAEIREKLIKKDADCTVISSLDDIAWTLNVRGNDIECTPVVLSFLAVSMEKAFWFVQKGVAAKPLADRLQADGITIRDYHEIYSFLEHELDGQALYLDPQRTNMLIYEKAEKWKKTLDKKAQDKKIIEGRNLTLLPKAIKNPVEVENMRQAHIKDAVACTKFIYWLKSHAASQTITELSAAEKLEAFRRQQEHYLGASFHTIAGYAKHGALPHYSVSLESNLLIKAENFFLIDSGGHYLEGTTDITRTIAPGMEVKLTEEQKHHYTLVLKGNIRLSSTKFKYECAGINLDHLAREALLKEGLDYNHGTGHGVGYLLCVHEPPNSFRCKVSSSRDECMKLEAGMITSNEPGLYLEGQYGIRIEDLIVCKKLEKNQFGQFMGFETLSFVPYERDAILTEELTGQERDLINQYHAKVFETIAPYLDAEEKIWLQEATAEL